MSDDPEEQKQPAIDESLVEDFADVYANQFHFDINTWDVRILLGQVNNYPGKPKIEWHTGLTMPWGSAKLFHYLLGINIAIYETNQGKIETRPGSMPPPVVPPSGDDDTEQNRAFYARALRLRELLDGEDRTH
jgi:hypothetical protein